MEKSFCQLIIDAAESHKDKVAMRIVGEETDGKYTFGAMLDAVRSIAFRLEKEGIEFGDRVALIGENHPRWAIAYYGILFRGAVCVPIDPHAEIETLTNFIENSEAKMAFIGEDFIKSFHKLEENLDRKLPAVVLQNIESSNGFQKFDDWTNVARPGDFDQQPTPAKMTDLAQLTYTSGTTGTPKGVPLTHSNIYHEAVGCQEVMKISENEVVLSVLPLFHVFAQVVNLWVVASVGGSVYYVKELAPAELTKAFETKEITLITGVPRLWYLFHKKIFDNVAQQSIVVRTLFDKLLKLNFFLREKFNINLGRKFFGKVHDGFGGKLNFTISAGSRFDEKIARDYHALGLTMIQGYGLTETTGAVSCTRFEDNVVGSVGKAINYAEIKLGELNDEGAGEVLIGGKMVFSGYYKNEEATKEAFTDDGWFKSGDLGKYDEKGNLNIVGRSKDVIVLPNGKNIHPEDLEVHYSKTPMVGEMCIIGVKDESSAMAGAEKLIAVVVPDFDYLKKNNIANSREAIRHEFDDLGRKLPEYQRVRELIVRSEALPRTATRKVKRFEVAKEFTDGKLQSGDDAPLVKKLEFTDEDRALMDSTVGKQVTKFVNQNVEQKEEIHPSMSLEIDLGLDSLSRAEVFAGLEQAFNIEFDSDEAANALTVKEVIKLVEKQTGTENAELVETDFNWGKIVREGDEKMPEMQTVLKSRPLSYALIFSVFKIFKFIARIFFSLEVTGKENIENLKRPFIVAPNHQSYLDPFMIAGSFKFDHLQNVFAIGASQFFTSSIMKSLAAFLNTVPVDPDTQLLKAMRASAVGLRHGKILVIFPEGARAFDGDLSEFKKGAAILAVELDTPVVPVALDGFYKVWGRSSGKISFAKTKIRYGKPFTPREIVSEAMDDEAKYAAVTEHLKAEIEAMLTEMRK